MQLLSHNKMKISSQYKKYIVALGVAILCILFFVFGLFNSWQEQLVDRLFLKQSQPKNIVIVAIDDKSLKDIGQWPWKRENFGKAIANMSGAKVIGFDINFAEQSRYGESDDKALTSYVASSTAPVIFPIEVSNLLNSNQKLKEVISVSPIENLKPFIKTGVVNVPIESDGAVRYVPKSSYPLFAEQILSINNSGVSQKFNTSDFNRISYQGPVQTFLTVSISDVINNKLPAGFFDNSYVLIGATAQSLRDIIKTPFGTMPGVEIHANILYTFLANKSLSPLNPILGVILLLIIAFLNTLVILTSKHFRALCIYLGLILVTIVVGALIAFGWGLILPFLYMLITFAVSSITLLSLNYIIESKEKKFIKQSFQYYLSPEVVEELTKNPEKLKLGGEKRELTILFSDIRGFTTISEKLSPEQLVEVINEYLSAMTDIIMKHGGLVDKYIGDAIMAFWGAPLDNPQHGIQAVDAALEMMEKLKELNINWVARNMPPIGIGIGINTGEVIVGNMGSQKRFNYTIMGDEVNFASRLEGITKQYGIQCILSESTIRKVEITRSNSSENRSQFMSRKVDMVMVKGKKEPKTIYELVPTANLIVFAGYKEKFESARLAYEKGDWDSAISQFQNILKDHEHDGPTNALLERSMYLKEHQPEDWKGVYEFKTK